MKKILFCAVALFSCCLFGAENNMIMQTEAYVSVRSKVPLKFDSVSEGVRKFVATTKDNEGVKNIIRCYRNNKTAEWEKAAFKFTAQDSGEVTLAFAGVLKMEGKKPHLLAVCYDDVKLDGKPIKNGSFEKFYDDWSLKGYNSAPLKIIHNAEFAKEGDYCLRTSFNRYVEQNFKVEKGKSYEITFYMKPVGEIGADDVDTFLNLKKSSNFGLVDWKALGVKIDLSKLDVKRKDFGGIAFGLINPADNAGKGAVLFASKKFKKGVKKIEIPVGDMGGYLYILHTSVYGGGGGSTAVLKMHCRDGLTAMFKLQRARDTYWFERGDPKKLVGNAMPVYQEDPKANKGTIYISKFQIPSKQIIDFIEIETEENDAFILLAATVTEKNIPTFETVECTLKDWSVADIPECIYVKKGSAMDLSGFFDKSRSGDNGRVIISERGTLAFEKTPDKDARFKGFSETSMNYFMSLPLEKRHAEIDRFVDSFKVNGFNCARLSFGGFERYGIDENRKAELYDIADYYIAAMKRNGIYIHHPWFSVPVEGNNFFIRDDVKLRAVFGEKTVRETWKKTALKNLNHINPYTGLAWKDDPVFLCMEIYNELAICFPRIDPTNKFDPRDTILPETRAFVSAKWHGWLKNLYNNDISALNSQWKKYRNRNYDFKSFDEVPCDIGNPDWKRCCWDFLREFTEYGRKALVEAGYKGLIVQNNLGVSLYGISIRWDSSDYTIGNTYFCHPSSFNMNSGSVSQISSIERLANYIRGISTCKLAGRPFFITEYNHCFWNKYRYEFPAMMPAYAAYKNFSGLTIHQDAVPLRPKAKNTVGFFYVANSPAARVEELYATSMFIRGDVKPAEHRVDLKVSDEFLKDSKSALGAVNSFQTQIGLLTGFELKFDGKVPEADKNVKVKDADVTIVPVGSSEMQTEAWFQSVIDGADGGFNLEKFSDVLRKKGVLSADNKTDIARGIFQTDTKQITLDSQKKTMKVVSPRTEIVAMENFTPVTLGALRVVSSTVPASVGVVSLDGKNISESDRLIFTYLTRENNLGMKNSLDNVISAGAGNGPITLLNGIVKAEIKLDSNKKYAVYPLSLTGERREKIPFEFKDGCMILQIDNSKLKYGSTAFFEIAVQ